MVEKESSNFRYLLYSYLLLLLVMFVLPFFSVDTYSIIKNTTSHLGEFWVHKILLSIFGLGLVFTGVFNHAPIIEGIIYNSMEDNLHSVFASIVGFSFTLYAISSAFIEKEVKHKVMDIIAGLTATFLSMLMGYIPDYSGIWQRAIFIISFTWLIFMLERIRAFKRAV